MSRMAVRTARRTHQGRRRIRRRSAARPAGQQRTQAAQAFRQVRAGRTPNAQQLLSLQRSSGNGAVTALLQRQAGLIQREDGPAAKGPAAGATTEAAEEKVAAIPTAVGYIGMNPGAAKEAKALKKVSKDKVLISLDDPKASKSLETPQGMGHFIYLQLGIDPTARPEKFNQAFHTLNGASESAREQVAHMMKWFADAEGGKHKLERLVFSGHSNGVSLWGESGDEHDPGSIMPQREVRNVAKTFPKAAAQVQDVMFSACFSLVAVQVMIDIFPNLKTAWGYIGFSPSIKQGSARHIKKWEMTTQGDNTPKAKDRKGTAAIWTKEQGYIVGSPADYDLAELRGEFNAYAEDIRAYYLGEKGASDDMVFAYRALQIIAIHPEASPEEVTKVRKNLDILLRLRFYSMIALRFVDEYQDQIDKAYAGFSVAKLDKGTAFNRQEFKKHLDKVDAALAAHDHKPMRAFLEKTLRPGLWQLSPAIIPVDWI